MPNAILTFGSVMLSGLPKSSSPFCSRGWPPLRRWTAGGCARWGWLSVKCLALFVRPPRLPSLKVSRPLDLITHCTYTVDSRSSQAGQDRLSSSRQTAAAGRGEREPRRRRRQADEGEARQRRIRIQGCATVEYGTAAVTGRRGSQASSFGKRNLTKKCYLNRLYEELKQAITIKRDWKYLKNVL